MRLIQSCHGHMASTSWILLFSKPNGSTWILKGTLVVNSFHFKVTICNFYYITCNAVELLQILKKLGTEYGFLEAYNLSCPLETCVRDQRQTKECLQSNMSYYISMTCTHNNSPHSVFPDTDTHQIDSCTGLRRKGTSIHWWDQLSQFCWSLR